ncbi:MAG TPA: exodeoxyribonuclease VII large subunit [Xanthobacteraceae bacterium]|nr:exodeoxyribonuclease VII large subunit [Xanthobacteraceae bacterium]
MSESARINVQEWTVSEISAALKRTVEDNYGYVRVRGELGNVKYHSSGHVYLDLKDERACLAGVIWRTTAARIKVKLEAGLEVVVTGKITTYPGQSKYQIVVDSLAPAGVGALMALLEERKKKLAAEGLFDAARKQLLPFLPNVIGVVTSPTGAVIRDILHRLSDRFPRHVLVWPVRVQGEGAAEEVAAAIRGFNTLAADGAIPRPDVLIVARGGGSLEDLWSFNEEIVARAAAESLIPLVSAVGHETDVTLIDFAADVRAPTPTAAAEMAVPVRTELMARLDGLARRNIGCWLRTQEARRTELRAAVRALPSGEELLAGPRQRLDGAADRLPRALNANAQIHRTALSQIAARLTPHLLRVQVERRRERYAGAGARLAAGLRHNVEAHRAAAARARDRVAALADRGARAIGVLLRHRAERVGRVGQLLAALSYHGVLARGFALVRDPHGRPLRAAASIDPGLQLDIEFADGHVGAVATGSPAAPEPAKPKRRRGGEGQGSLFGA